MKKQYGWKIIARHDWINEALITESVKDTDSIAICRFTATIKKFRNWKIYQGEYRVNLAEDVARCVMNIRDLIESGDEEIFYKKGYFIKEDAGVSSL